MKRLTPAFDPETGKRTTAAMRAIASGMTHVGLQRDHNEDSFAVLSEYDLFIVADGMGGHRAGDVASRLATDAVAEFFRTTATEDVTWPFHFDTSLSEEENRLLAGIRVANRQIFERSVRSRECAGMGTTIVGALFSKHKKRLYVGHVGDSRCYRIRGPDIFQMTRDHSLVSDAKHMAPWMTAEEVRQLPPNVITRALGIREDVLVDLVTEQTEAGDVYLLCSDGLSGLVSDPMMHEIVTSTPSLDEACRSLIERANFFGGTDNITAILARVEETDAENPKTLDEG
jgi:PPM family protein phosphatase